MAVRICPICGGQIISYPGVSLRSNARIHHQIVHDLKSLDKQEQEIWFRFYRSLPKERFQTMVC